MIQSCELRHSVTIEEPTETQDATGQPITSWTTFATARAKIDTTTEFGRDTEVFVGNELVASAGVIFTMRYISGLTEKMRISYNGDYYDIIGIADVDMRHAFHQVRARRGLIDA